MGFTLACWATPAVLIAFAGCGGRSDPAAASSSSSGQQIPTTASAAATPGTAPKPVRLTLVVDATDLARGLLHARETIPVTPGLVWLWFPKWMPGTHAPCGPVENLGGLRFTLPTGERLAWRRDDVELNRFGVTVPAGADRLVASIDYICNQPSENSKGIDSAGDGSLGVISWNTCLLYPEGPDEDTVLVEPRIRLPSGWKQASALELGAMEAEAPNDPAQAAEGDTFSGHEVSLRELIDAPLIAGEHLARYDVSSVPDHGVPLRLELDALAEDETGVTLDAEAQASFARLADEVHEQFPGPTPFQTYHLLAVASEVAEPTGLEHESCSLNTFQRGALVNPPAIAEQMAHEFCHAWCGKYRRPAGMYTRDFHTPERTHLLWVYEGLDMYLGEIMASRAQLGTDSGFVERLQAEAQELALHTGRDWRSVDDTAIANWQLRGPSAHWGQLRRDQDYYLEGMLMWLEIDGIIRSESNGARSLDDFCREFFRVEGFEGGNAGGSAKPKPYGVDDIVAALQAIQPHDWRALIDERMLGTSIALSFAGFERCGWRVRFAGERGEPMATYATRYQYLDESWSLGLVLQKGVIKQVLPGSPADRARLAPGMRVTRIGGKPMSVASVDQALADSTTSGAVALRCQSGTHAHEVSLAYAGGPRYFALERIASSPDLLAAVSAPRSARGKEFVARQPAGAEGAAGDATPTPQDPEPDRPAEGEPAVEPHAPAEVAPPEVAAPDIESGAAAAAAGGAVAPAPRDAPTPGSEPVVVP